MFMILRTSPCYIRQVQSSISPNNSQNISENSEAWLRARPEQHQTAGEERLQHLCSGQLRKDSGLDRLSFPPRLLSTGAVTLDMSLNVPEPWQSHLSMGYPRQEHSSG